jgi:hypothetical protein
VAGLGAGLGILVGLALSVLLINLIKLKFPPKTFLG